MATIKSTRSPLFYRNPAGGLPYISNESVYTGNIFFVDSAAASASDTAGQGWSPDKPFATIDFAIGQCTANQGDVIFVLPGHAETLNTVGAITADIAGISIIGLGNGEDRPTLTVGSSLDTTTVLISAADVKLKNLILQPGNDGVDVLIDIDADGAIIEECELRSDETNAYQADTYIDVAGGANGADRTTIQNCKITSITAGAAQAINIGAVEDALVIKDCWIDGDFTAAGILSGSIFTNALIDNNTVSNRAAGVHAIEFTAACTGMATNNKMYGSTLGTIFDPGSLKCLGNLETDAIDQAGVPSPRTMAGDAFPSGITSTSFAAGAIDAAAIANSAIDAATFAAGAIDAAAIAANAIDFATFAADVKTGAGLKANVESVSADAITAAAIANGAIDAATFAAGAIDAAAIANGAIDAATFAAGAIDAAAIAAGAIDAATFAAGAIDAAAIANGAIDAATFAAGAIDAAAIAAAAIDSATFAADAAEKTTDGYVITKATAALPQTAAAAIFTVTGLVLLKRLVGYVTVQIGAVANATKIQGNSTGAGATTDLSGTLDINGHVVDSRYEITGTFANAMVRTLDVPLALTQAANIVIPPGTIDVNCAGSDGGTGRVRWSATYVPLEAGASIVAA